MLDTLRTWILGIAAAALISGIAGALTPPGKARRVVSLVCGFLTIALMLAPLREFDLGRYASYQVEFNEQRGVYGIRLENENERLVKAIIEERGAAYILDKAAQLGIEYLRAEVAARAGEAGAYPVPWEAALRGEATEEQRAKLGGSIEAELGIPAARQRWEDGTRPEE
jgi:hypothetical protein